VTEGGERKEETEFHRIVAWNKLAEICAQFLAKGRRTYVEGRLQIRQWTTQDGAPRQTTEIVINEMIILDSRRGDVRELPRDVSAASPKEFTSEKEAPAEGEKGKKQAAKVKKEEGAKPRKGGAKTDESKLKKEKSDKKKPSKEKKEPKQEVSEDDIPF